MQVLLTNEVSPLMLMEAFEYTPMAPERAAVVAYMSSDAYHDGSPNTRLAPARPLIK